MNNQLESVLVRKIIAYLKTLSSCYWYRTHGGTFASRVGIPDLLICYRGVFVGIEVKIKPNTPTPLQKIEIAKINLAGGVSGVAYSLEDVVTILEHVAQRGLP